MHRFLLGALFTGALAVASAGCDSASGDLGSLSESALKGTLPDGGSCHCVKVKKDKPDAGKGVDVKGQPDASMGKSDGPHGKSDEPHGKSDEPHGNPDAGVDDDDESDEDAASDESTAEDSDMADEEDSDALRGADGGLELRKPASSGDCICG